MSVLGRVVRFWVLRFRVLRGAPATISCRKEASTDAVTEVKWSQPGEPIRRHGNKYRSGTNPPGSGGGTRDDELEERGVSVLGRVVRFWVLRGGTSDDEL